MNESERFFKYAIIHPISVLIRLLKLRKIKEYEVKNIRIEKSQIKETISNKLFVNIQWSKSVTLPDRLSKMKLAGTVENEFDVKNINWFNAYSDPEDIAALHRFIWMYKMTFQNFHSKRDKNATKDLLVEAIKDWIANVESKNKRDLHFEVWQSYTVSERITNWIISLLMAGNEFIDEKTIIDSIVKQVGFLVRNLEDYGEPLTCNHLSNNGRALYIAGLFLDMPNICHLGRKIILNEATRLIESEIFLREGSSHYQFIILKNYMELYYFSLLYQDNLCSEELFSILTKLIKGGEFFLYHNRNGILDLPRIGDISPDYDPDMLVNILFVAKYIIRTKNLQQLSIHKIIDDIYFQKHGVENSKTKILGSWAKLVNYNWLLYSHCNNARYPYNLGHFHNDTLGIILYFEGIELIMDCGRINYKEGEIGINQKLWRGHSTIVIENSNHEMEYRRFYTSDYVKNYFSKKPQMLYFSDTHILELTNNAYTRFTGCGVQKRRIMSEEQKIVIQDEVLGNINAKFNIEVLFHIPYESKMIGKGIVYETGKYDFIYTFDYSDLRMTIIRGSEENILYGQKASYYGDSQYITTIKLSGQVKLPYKGKAKIEVIKKCVDM